MEDVETWIGSVLPERQEEARRLARLFAEETGFAPWAQGAILGFGRYDYRYDSGHSGTAPATGFAPRKAEIVIYLQPGFAGFQALAAALGKVRLGKACLYIKRLDQVDEGALRALIRAGLADLGQRWPVRP